MNQTIERPMRSPAPLVAPPATHPLILPGPVPSLPDEDLPHPDVRALLIRALDYFDREGWYRGNLFRTPQYQGVRRTGPACLVGCLVAAYDPDGEFDLHADGGFQRMLHTPVCLQALRRVAWLLPTGGGSMGGRVSQWNDNPWRGKDEVRRVLVQAIG